MDKRTVKRGVMAPLGAALAVAFAMALAVAQAHAQDPVYDIPLPPAVTPAPTATPTPAPTPAAGPARMRPFPRVRTAGSYTASRTIFTRVTVSAPRGARIVATCSRRRCRTTRRSAGTRAIRLTRLQRSYRPGTTITIRITSPAAIGKHVEIRTLRGDAPRRRDRCLPPGARKPVTCEGL